MWRDDPRKHDTVGISHKGTWAQYNTGPSLRCPKMAARHTSDLDLTPSRLPFFDELPENVIAPQRHGGHGESITMTYETVQ